MTFWKHPIILISIGGALGANARYWLGYWIKKLGLGGSFPWGTFLANVSGSLLLALLTVVILKRMPAERKWLYLMLGTGFCGAYTTFSTFKLETWTLIEKGRWAVALLNVLGSVLAGFFAVVIAMKLLKR